MFEYLMPSVILHAQFLENSLPTTPARTRWTGRSPTGMRRACRGGFPNRAYSALDANQIYQYKAFGVPALALKSGLSDDLVVSPYSTMLALLVDPVAAIDNLRRLDDFELQGPMGYYESIDFSRENKRDGKRGVVIYAYMAHHQGMSLLALNNLLHRDTMQERFHSDAARKARHRVAAVTWNACRSRSCRKKRSRRGARWCGPRFPMNRRSGRGRKILRCHAFICKATGSIR